MNPVHLETLTRQAYEDNTGRSWDTASPISRSLARRYVRQVVADLPKSELRHMYFDDSDFKGQEGVFVDEPAANPEPPTYEDDRTSATIPFDMVAGQPTCPHCGHASHGPVCYHEPSVGDCPCKVDTRLRPGDVPTVADYVTQRHGRGDGRHLPLASPENSRTAPALIELINVLDRLCTETTLSMDVHVTQQKRTHQPAESWTELHVDVVKAADVRDALDKARRAFQ